MPPKVIKPKLSKIEKLSQKSSKNDSDDDITDQPVATKRAEVKTRDKELEFKRLTLHEQILLRPDTYIGSTKRIKSSDKVWVFDNEIERFVYKYVTYPEGLLRIFMEPVSNVIDNIWRSKQFKIPTKIMKINVDRETGIFEVWNDGKPISLDRFEENGVKTDDYIIEVIFGQLLSSTNYNDAEERKTSGRNGYGSKLTNIFSSEFKVEAYNPTFKSIYRQTWRDNMKIKSTSVIENKNIPTGDGKNGYTKISWRPDYKRFGMSGIDDDFMCVIERVVYNYSLIAFTNGVNTIYNGKDITIKKLEDYAAMHFDQAPQEIIRFQSDDCEVVLTPRPSQEGKNDLMQVSFMNGIQTFEGGVHVDVWEEAIFRPIVNKINGTDEKKKKEDKKKKTSKTKTNNVDITHIRRHFMVFIVAEKDKPEFKSQEKTYFTGPPVTCNVRAVDINKITKWSFMEKVEESIRLKQLMEFKEVGKKKRNFTRVENLDDANNAGRGKHAQECILCVTEGLSAATYVINGMAYGIEGKVGRDWIGVLPVTGKFLNVRNASTKSILDNKIVKSFIRAVGLEYGLDYMQQENRAKLRYGKLYMIADGDNDGCFDSFTPVNMYNGTSMYIKDTDHINSVLAWKAASDTETDGIINTDMERFLDQGEKDCIEVLFEDGRKIVCTPDHRICDSDGNWVESQDSLGKTFKMTGVFPSVDYDGIPKDWSIDIGNMKLNTLNKKEIDKTLAFMRILGYLLSDGHVGTKKLCEFYLGNIIDMNALIKDLELFIPKDHISHFSQDFTTKSGKTSKNFRVRVRTEFVDQLIQLDGFQQGKRSTQPGYLPLFLFDSTCPNLVIREFLGGFFGGDGVAPSLTKYKTRVGKNLVYRFTGLGIVQSKVAEYTDSLKDMMTNIQTLLQNRFNISSNIVRPCKNKKGTSLTMKLNINTESYLEFANTIGFRYCIHKIQRMSCVQSYYNLYMGICDQRKQIIEMAKEYRKSHNIEDSISKAVNEFSKDNFILHPSSIPKEGTLKINTNITPEKRGCKVGSSGFYTAIEFLRKINGLQYFINEKDLSAETDRQGSSHYGVDQTTEHFPTMNLGVISIKRLSQKRHVYDISVKAPYHSFLANGIVAHNCHITGLMINFVDTLFPSLLQSGEFLRFMRIPIIKVNTRSEQMSFLFYHTASKWIEEHNPNKNSVRYFKGLATSTDEDIRDDFGRYPVVFQKTDECSDALNKVFHKDEADFRKEWILNFTPKIKQRKTLDYQLETLSIAEFLNEEMINFSIDDCKRSIPNVLDGLKESQRKVLFGAFKRNLTKQLKVAQFAAYVAEKSAYLHGENNLYATIISMAQRFTGSNNIPLFTNKGQFGSRLENGKDAGAGRYLFTQLESITRLLFRKDDESYLDDRTEESMTVEKEYYIPIIPMILVNGSQGIGTGSSCTVPSYNPADLIKWIRAWIAANKGKEADYPDLIPYWRGFKGTVELSDKSVITYGNIGQTGANKYEITELPIGRLNTSISKYRDHIDEMLENKYIKDRKNYCTDNDVHFVISADGDSMIPTVNNMKLKDSISLTNLTFFNREGKLVKYKNVYEIMNYFCEQRLDLYGVRIKGEIAKLNEELKWVNNKIRYIDLVHKGEIEIKDRDETLVVKDLSKLKFDKKSKHSKRQSKRDEESDEEGSDNEADEEELDFTYDYLLDMKIRSLNIKSEAYKNLQNKRENILEEIDTLENTTSEDLWLVELQEFETEYGKWTKAQESNETKKVKNLKKAKKSGKDEAE